MPSDLSEEEVARVVALVDRRLHTFACPTPRIGEAEPQFTGRVFVPEVRGGLEELGIPGFTVAGEGVHRPIPTYLLGHSFYPDLSISYYGDRIVAYEVKFLRRGGRSNSISKALGQCLLYQLDRYPLVRALLVECDREVSSDDVRQAEMLFGQASARIGIIYCMTRDSAPTA